jgi:UDP-2,3-diacylglucosamine pyrophosphatase LpxH
MKNRNILVISDLHIPFEKPGYFEFVKEQYERFNCNQVVFIGDIIDNHFGSYHEVDSDAWGAKYELEQTIKKVKRWYKAFPKADVMIGNHDQIVSRKAMTGGIPQQWIKGYSDVLGTPNWKWSTDVVYDNVRYSHGHKSGKAKTGHKRDMHSLVTGHYHLDMYIDWNYGIDRKTFGMAVGSGADDQTYNANYAAGGRKSAYGCGVVLDNGTLPIVIPMDLDKYKDFKLPKKKKKKKKNKKKNKVQPIIKKTKENKYYTPNPKHGSQRTIINIETLEEYSKAKDVAEQLGVTPGHLSSMLNGRMKNKTPFRYL